MGEKTALSNRLIAPSKTMTPVMKSAPTAPAITPKTTVAKIRLGLVFAAGALFPAVPARASESGEASSQQGRGKTASLPRRTQKAKS